MSAVRNAAWGGNHTHTHTNTGSVTEHSNWIFPCFKTRINSRLASNRKKTQAKCMTTHAHTHTRAHGYYTHTHTQTHTWSRRCFLYARKLYAQFICTAYCRDFELDFASATASMPPCHLPHAHSSRSTLHTRCLSRLRFAAILFTLYKYNSHIHTDNTNDINFGNTLCQLSVLNKPTTTT